MGPTNSSKSHLWDRFYGNYDLENLDDADLRLLDFGMGLVFGSIGATALICVGAALVWLLRG
jgi:hypothetical protein